MPRQAVNNLVKNGNFEYAPASNVAMTSGFRWLDGTALGSSTNYLYRWAMPSYGGSYAAIFDNTEKYSRSYSLKLSTTATASYVRVNTNLATAASHQLNNIPCLPSTSYTLSFMMKTSVTSGAATTGAYASIVQKTGDGITSAGATTTAGSITTSTGWTSYTATVTTSATARFLAIELGINGNDGAATLISSAWFDDIRLDLTSNTTRSVASNRLAVQDMKSSLSFNGTSTYMTSTVVPDITGFSFGLWINAAKLASNDRIVDYSDSGPTNGMSLTISSTNFLTLSIYNGASQNGQVASLAVLPKRWVHVSGTFIDNSVKLYVDSVLQNTDTSAVMTAATQTLTIGRRSAAATNYFGGSISNFVWQNTTTPWTQAQVTALYNGTAPAGATQVLPLNEGAGSIAYDSSGNGNNGTITSGTYVLNTPSKKRKAVNGNLVYNGDFEYAPVVNAGQTGGDTWINGTVAGSSSNKFGWYVYSYNGTRTAEFDTSVYYSGTKSLKLSLGATSSNIGIASNKTSGNPKIEADGYIPLLPNTSYTASVRVKTNITSGSATTGVAASFVEKIGVGTGSTITVLVTGLITTQDWTQYTATFTTGATTRYGAFELRLTGNNGAATLIGDAWFDDIQLVPTTAVARTVAT